MIERLLLLLLLMGCTPAVDSPDRTEVVMEGLDTPWDIAFFDDGFLVTERPGRVRHSDGTVLAEVPVLEESESGLMGIAIHPENQGIVYLYYTAPSGENRISRFVLSDRLENETVILDGIPYAQFHDGGRLAFGPDGMLYATTGDATRPGSAQDTDSLAGKILRMTPTGGVPEDNPFGNYVYSYGHRNPQGLAWLDGQLYASEHGPTRHDEINRIVPGGNYGWPDACGDQGEGTIQPLRCYAEFTLAPASLASWRGDLYAAGLRGSQVRRVPLNGTDEIFLDGIGRIRLLKEWNGSLYVGTSNRDGRGMPRPGDDRILRIEK